MIGRGEVRVRNRVGESMVGGRDLGVKVRGDCGCLGWEGGG